MTDYLIQRLGGQKNENSEQHVLKLWNLDDRKELKTSRLTLSKWQIEEMQSYSDRLKDWAQKVTTEDIPRENIDIEPDTPNI